MNHSLFSEANLFRKNSAIAFLLSAIYASSLVLPVRADSSGKGSELVDPQKQLEVEYKLHFADPQRLQQAGYKFECKGNYEQAIAIYSDILKRFPKYPDRLYLRDHLKALRYDLENDYVATKAREARIASAKSKDELERLKSKMTDAEFMEARATAFALRMPLKVYVHPAKGQKGYRPELHNILIKSLVDWPKISDGRIQLKLVSSPSDADIECFWTDKKSDLQNEAAAAITKYESVGHSKIYMLTMLSGAPVTSRVSKSICLHEFGHAFGLSHTRDPKDIMCGFGQDPGSMATTPSSTDRSRILSLYSPVKVEERRKKNLPLIHANMAYALWLAKSGDRALALKAIDHALEYDKNNSRAWLIRSGINVRRYQFDRAIADLSIAEKLDPGNRRIILAKRALINVFRRHYEDARNDFAGALEAGFYTPSYFTGLAITKVVTRQDVDILKNLDEAIAKSPFDSTNFKVRSLVCFLEGDTTSAIANSKTYFEKNNWKDADAVTQALLCYYWSKQIHDDTDAMKFLSEGESHARANYWKVLIRFVKGEISEQELHKELATRSDTIDLRLWTALNRVKSGEELDSKELVQSIDEQLWTILTNICWHQFFDSESRAFVDTVPLEQSHEREKPTSTSNDQPEDDPENQVGQ